MKVVECADAKSLWGAAEAYLARDPANHTHTLSSLVRLQRDGALHDERFLAVLDDAGACHGTLVRMDTQHCFLSTITAAAATALAQHINAVEGTSRGFAVRGAVGAQHTVHAFASALARPATPYVSLMLYQHQGEINAGNAKGAARMAVASDAEAVATMLDAFDTELAMVKTTTSNADRAARRIRDGEIMLWTRDGVVVAMAGANLLPVHSVRIGPVYTAPAYRGQGIAQAITAATTAHTQRDGPRTVFLFTDASNPASNKAYQRIGFVHVADHAHLMFGAQAST